MLAPKLQGFINLHEASSGIHLEFFIMPTSFVTLVGSATEAAYSAATAFQSYFARWRLAEGLPAQAVALTAIGHPKYAEERRLRIQRARISETNGAAFLPQDPGPDTIKYGPLSKACLVSGFEPDRYI